MALVTKCDRCGGIAKECARIFEHDLCELCTGDLRAWIAAGSTRFKPAKSGTGKKGPRNAPAASLAVCALVADATGRVSARAFSEATQEDYRASYQRLRHLHRKGLIDRVSGSIYRLRAEAAE